MASYYVHPSGTGATQAQCQSASTPAPSLNRLFSFVSGGTGFADGDVIYVAGQIRGTAANPEYGYASYNLGAAAVAITFQPWGIDQPNPAGLTLSPPLLRGDAPCGSFTWNVAGYYVIDAALPTGKAVSGVTYRWGEVKNRDGVPMAHLTYTTSTANCAATANSFYYNSGTGVLYVNVTNPVGTQITGGTLASGLVGYMTEDGNSLLELQNARNCTIRGMATANTCAYYGIYHVNTTNATGCVIEDCHSLDGASHHYFGHTGSNPDTTGSNVIRRCSGRRGYGTFTSGNPASAGSFYGISNFSGATLNNMVNEDLDYQPGMVLSPAGVELYTGVSRTFGVGAHVAGDTSGQTGNIIRRSSFRCRQGGGATTAGAISIVGATPPSGLVANNPATYPVLYQDCYLGIGFGGVATPGAGVTTHRAYAAFQRCTFDHLAGGSVFTSGTPIVGANYSNICWNFNIAIGSDDRSYLFDRCTFIVDMDTLGSGSVFNNLFYLANSTTLRFQGCTFLMVGRNSSSNNQYVFTWTSNAATSSVICSDSIFCFPFATSNDRELCANDTTWLANDTRRQFSRNFYIGLSKFSQDSAFDTGAEWCNASTGVDTSGVYYNSVITATGWPLFEASTLRADLARWANNSTLRRTAVSSLASLTSGVALTRNGGALAGAGGDGPIVYPVSPRLRQRYSR